MIPLFRDRRGVTFVLLIANGFGQALSAIVAAFAVEHAFTRFGQPNSAGDIASVAGVLAGAAALSAILRARERVDAERLGQSYVHELRMHLFRRLTAMSPRAVSRRSQGSTALRFVGDLSAVRKWVSLGLSRLAVATTMIVGTLAALSVVDPLLATATGAAALLGGIGAIVQGPSLREADRRARRQRSKLAGTVTETIGAVGVVQSSNAVNRERRRVGKRSRRLRSAMIDRARRLGRLTAIAEATGSAATALLLLAALHFRIPAPEVAAGMTVVGLLVPQLRGLARVQEYRQRQQVAVDAIQRFLDRPAMLTEPEEPISLPQGPGRIRLVAASHGVVREVTATAEPGRTVAVVGPNGAGKSTLLAMIGRLVDLDAGRVLFEDVDLAEVSLADVRAAVGMAGPDLPLMKGSLRRNLTYRDKDVDDAVLQRTIERCGLGPLIEELDGGLDFRISEGGANLSSGQRQRIMLGRAILTAPRVLLLDEADANLDSATADLIDAVLTPHIGPALIITHRLERAMAADDLWHLADGRLVEQGPPDQLLKPGTATAALFGVERTPELESGELVSA
ncbi:ABC transporter ATP-binding protein [Euzebya tangerina]|uniref:ABC transporter ATP-binding protein n=1 Tax=Euzebya tangerina TaxID=591198 RepID=UPI000E30F67B|nr:ABC transporter ATP-binding protein [Euzebya tangerina]